VAGPRSARQRHQGNRERPERGQRLRIPRGGQERGRPRRAERAQPRPKGQAPLPQAAHRQEESADRDGQGGPSGHAGGQVCGGAGRPNGLVSRERRRARRVRPRQAHL